MITSREELLMTLLNCGSADLSLLDDIGYDWSLVFARMGEMPRDINSVMWTVFQLGYEDIQTDIDDRICELEAITNERELYDEEEEELARLRELEAAEDFGSYHNYLDTHVYCERHGSTYKEYMGDALDEFEENTGFSISFNED